MLNGLSSNLVEFARTNLGLFLDCLHVQSYHGSMAKKRPKTTLTLEREYQERLRAIALSFGYVVKHGNYAGQGNISLLNEAIATGELVVVPKSAVDAARRMEASNE